MPQHSNRYSLNRLRCVAATILMVFLLGLIGCWSTTRSETSDKADSRNRKTASASALTELPLLTEVTEEVGLDFVHEAGKPGRYFFPAIMSAGGALFDYDLDGDLDIYLINGSLEDEADREGNGPSDRATNRLYRQDPSGQFVDVTHGSGLDDASYGMGVAVGDVNNDGFPDVYTSRGHILRFL